MTNIESKNELPSMAKLIKSTILAIGIAVVILLTVVLPAEYGIDPTGVGNMIGLLKMGEIKTSLAQDAEADRAEDKIKSEKLSEHEEETAIEVAKNSDETSNIDERQIVLKPNEGKEIKLAMLEGETVDFVWFTDGGKANFDAHADSKKLEINYHSYGKGKLEKNKGVMEAAFDGNHGWFWRNRTSETMVLTLQVNGTYSDINIME